MGDRSGRSSLHYAALNNDIAGVERALVAGDDPNTPDVQGFAPLHLAAESVAAEAAAVLIDHGGDVDAANVHGNTPLFVAVFNSKGDGRIIKLLRAHGADVFHVNRAGQTPVGLARLIGNYDVAQFFEDIPY